MLQLGLLGRLNGLLAGTSFQLVHRQAHATPKPVPHVGQDFQELRSECHQIKRDLLRHQISSRWSLYDDLSREMLSASTSLVCPLCTHEDIASHFAPYDSYCIFGGGALHRRQCPKCDVIFGPEKMLGLSAQALCQEYEWHYQAYSEGDSTESELRAFHSLQPRRDGVYLNYGAGSWSKTVRLLREDGWHVYSYEPHASASEESAWQIDQTALGSMRFDGIFSNNVLEHLRYPVQELQHMALRLTPDGRMAHATACYEYLYEYTRFHLFFYPGRSREVLFQKSRLDLLEFVADGDYMCALVQPNSAQS